MRSGLRGVVIVSLLALALLSGLPGSLAFRVNPIIPSAATMLASGACPGSPVPVNFTAQVVAVGAPWSPPPVTNVSVALAYYYQMSHVPNGGTTAVSCQPGSVKNSTDSTGNVRLVAVIPSGSCDRVSCNYYTGPFGPDSFSLPAGPPPGYFVSTSSHGGSTTLDLVAALSHVSVAPLGGRMTVSVFAPLQVHANATAGDGRPSPANVMFQWSIEGRGWSITGGAGTSTLTVLADGGGTAQLSLGTNGTFGSGSFALPVQTLQLNAITTEVTSSSLVPTSLDSGAPATFSLQGDGSAGYAYVAVIQPGLGLAPLLAPCLSSAAPGAAVTLSCVALATYPSPGVAQPTANLSNGFSVANTNFGTITVAPSLAVSLGPDRAIAYVGSPIDLNVQVATHSGTGPFSPACLWTGTGTVECLAGPGPSWSFPVTYGTIGAFVVRATVADAAGSNRTASAIAQVFDRPAIDPIHLSADRIEVGGTVSLSSNLRGGAMAASYWWNDSAPNGTADSGVVDQDGPIRATLSLSSPGLHRLSLSVRDSLGTVVAQSALVDVLSLPTRIVDAFGPSPLGVTAGTPWGISWMAADPIGGHIPGYSTNVTLSLPSDAPPHQTAWVNTSGVSLLLSPGSAVLLPAAAWHVGFLNFSVTSLVAGPLSLVVQSDLPLGSSSSGRLAVSVFADFDHPLLHHPMVVHSGIRSNATRWSISDRWGNPLTSGFVVVRTVFGPLVSNSDSPVEWNGTDSGVWVNYSAPSGAAGTVYVLSEWGDAVLLRVGVPGPSVRQDASTLLLGAAAAAFLITGLALGWYRSRRRPGDTGEVGAEVGEEELRRVAEGRAHLMRRFEDAGPLSLDELGEGFDGPRPSRAELAEWVGGLVSEGALAASPGPDGTPRFVAVERVERAHPRVEVDPELLEAALSRQSETDAFPEEDP